MRFVEQLVGKPGRCVFYPQHGPAHPQGFVQSNTLIEDYYLPGVSVAALLDIAEQVPQAGIARRSDLTLAQAKIADLEREVGDLRAQLAEADKFAEAAEWTLKHFGTRVQSKPGRKPAVKA